MKDDIVLRAENISKSFYGVKALDNVRLELRRGQVHALCGENGAGKSTLLKIITGLYTRDSGTIWLDGAPVTVSNVADAQKLGVYVVPQEMQMLRDMSVAENIFLGKYPRNRFGLIDWRQMYALAEQVKRRLGGHAESLNVRAQVGNLGMGSWQLIEIMRALISENIKVLAFDEPTSSLSDGEVQTLFQLIGELKRQGISIIYVSHRLNEVFAICDQVSVFKDGQYVGTRDIATTTSDQLVAMMIGRDLDLYGERKDRGAIQDRVALKVAGFTNGKAYRDISFELRAGEILGLYGLVGAGRTEFARGLFGVDRKEQGQVWINGQPVHIASPKVAKQHGLGFVTENRREEGLMQAASLKWNISMPNLLAIMSRPRRLNLRREVRYAESGMKLFRVKAAGIGMAAGSLSGGNQQKVVLAKWVMSDSQILIVDEPTRGIDVGAKQEVYEALKDLARKGKAILVISSDLPEILGISDRILVFCEGRVTADLENIGLTEDQVIAHAFVV